MQEIKVNSKFGVGAKVFTIWNRAMEFECPICKGEGSFIHKINISSLKFFSKYSSIAKLKYGLVLSLYISSINYPPLKSIL